MSIQAETTRPDPTATITSLRAVGYKIEAAIADIIDNSISANSKNIWINFEWNDGSPWLSIQDDGDGMSEEKLVEAMKIGCADPDTIRDINDLGRFGLGLKTASFSQAKILKVISKTSNGSVVNRIWDLNYVRNIAKDWVLLKDSELINDSTLLKLKKNKKGTIVIWEHLDRLSGIDSTTEVLRNNFYRIQDSIKTHLGVVFHRYIEGKVLGREKLNIYINGIDNLSLVSPWDPFQRLKFDQLVQSQPLGYSKSSNIFGIILPHKDHIKPDEMLLLQKPGTLTDLQGIYIYRADRILCYGGWLDLNGIDSKKLRTEEVYRLARVCIEIQNSEDTSWSIDIKKSMATPPAELRKEIESYCVLVRDKAKQIYWFREKRGSGASHFTEAPEIPVWKDFGANKKLRYEINRTHQVVEAFRNALNFDELSNRFERVLKIIERSVPIEKIYIQSTSSDFSSDPHGDQMDDATAIEFNHVFETFYEINYKRLNKTREAFDLSLEMVSKIEPFNKYQSLKKYCRRKGNDI